MAPKLSFALLTTTLVLLASRNGVTVVVAQQVDCNNADTLQFNYKTKRYICSWLMTQTSSSRTTICSSKDSSTGKLIGLTCAKECPAVSKCPVYGPYPSGPYITAKNATERIIIPRPTSPSNLNASASSRTDCPHLATTDLKRWHDSSTWGTMGVPSTTGQNVTIPEGVKVLINQTITTQLGYITVPNTSQLIFGEVAAGISLSLRGMNVYGALIAGSETCRIETPITITLIGNRPVDAVTNRPPLNFKGISVAGGTLDLHGKRYFSTWTRLAKTVNAGDSVLMLQEPVNWKAGQELILVTSRMKDSRDYNFNEVVTVNTVHPSPPPGVGSIVYLTAPVKYSHTATTNYQVEVGLLTRMIKIQGDAASEPTDPDPLNCKDDRASQSGSIYFNTTRPCMDKRLTGFGGHMVVHSGGVGRVEGVQLYRMGQTNVLGRYPMHFHLLGNCSTCYFRDSSIHRSFYRCISIHGTNQANVTENVAYDITGFCYYLEDGVEQDNTISYNLAAHIHTLGPDIPYAASGTYTKVYTESSNLTLPADVTASGFYLTNINNYIIGNAASGGWSGFAFPSLPYGMQSFRNLKFRPSTLPGLVFDGNTAHSTGWWWSGAGAFYMGGNLYYNANNQLEYNPGRTTVYSRDDRRPCNVNPCDAPYNDCGFGCPENQLAWIRFTNIKAFLTAGTGLNSWSGRLELNGYESHDNRIVATILSDGFWMNNLLSVCRTGSDLGMQNNRSKWLDGNGFNWYDVGQKQIITNATFRNCGYRSASYAQYDNSTTRGCGDELGFGCTPSSSVFGFTSFSDQNSPEIMQGTRNIVFQNCGRRFKFTQDATETISGREQSWIDADGSASQLGVPTLIGSGLSGAKDWWGVENDVAYDSQAPLIFIKKNNGPQRSLGHIRFFWDNAIHSQVGKTVCGSGQGYPCVPQGFMRHLGYKFSPRIQGASVNAGLPVTAQPKVVGPIGGFGWLFNLNQTAPRSLKLYDLEIDPGSVLMLSIPYPVDTQFTIKAKVPYCWNTTTYKCEVPQFAAAASIDEVRQSLGNKYFVDSNGVLTLRVVQIPNNFVGNPNWTLADYNTTGRGGPGTYAIRSFSREGIVLPVRPSGGIEIQARCPSDTVDSPLDGYCPEPVSDYDPDVCDSGFVQVAYDTCCMESDLSKCKFADGSKNF